MWCIVLNGTTFQGGVLYQEESSLNLVVAWRYEAKEVWQQMHMVVGHGSGWDEIKSKKVIKGT